MEKVCAQCGKSFNAVKSIRKYCSLKCLWAGQIKEVQTRRCLNCGEKFILPRNQSKKNNDARLYCGKSCAYHGSERNKNIAKQMGTLTGKKNNNWKGEYAGYSPKHKWVEREKGKASNLICECCKKKTASDWSNIDHKYKRKLEDYRALCRSCHRIWDHQINGRKTN
jgi:hypothetical protein